MNRFTFRRTRQKYRAQHFNRAFSHSAVPVKHQDRYNVNEFTPDLCRVILYVNVSKVFFSLYLAFY